MVRTRKFTSIAIAAIVIVAALFAVLPTQQASADYWYGAYISDGFMANVHATAYETSTQIFCWMQVRATLYRWDSTPGYWAYQGTNMDGGDWINTLSVDYRKWCGGEEDRYFQAYGKIEYDPTGSDYGIVYATGYGYA